MGKRGFVDKHNASADAKPQKQVDIIGALGGYDSLLSQGAEGRVFGIKFCGRDTVVKQRFKKTYRHPTLDTKLTKSRLGMEARSMMRARKLGVVTPTLYYVDQQQSAIYMEKVPGKSLKELIRDDSMSEADMENIGAQVGRAVAKMHDGGLIHGDLTTGNILVRDANGQGGGGERTVVIIDFGLASNSIIAEDKGVDLYVLERAITVTHSSQALFEHVMTAYRRASSQWSSSFNKFAEVRTRGRKRSMIG